MKDTAMKERRDLNDIVDLYVAFNNWRMFIYIYIIFDYY